MDEILRQLIALSCYTLFMGFCFCDGFKLHVVRKLIWFALYAAVCAYTVQTYNQFDMPIILSTSALIAFVICWNQVHVRKIAGHEPGKS